jgi:inorganic pyrophosphatase
LKAPTDAPNGDSLGGSPCFHAQEALVGHEHRPHPTGANPPDSLNVIIEVPVGGEPVKYEFDKKSGALFVDRILHTPMRYPANYGFIPHTLSPDGDPLDALVVARSPFIQGSVVRARPIAVLFLEDEAGGDEKLLTVPVDTTFPLLCRRHGAQDLPSIVMQQIEHFFTHYKDLEAEKWVRVGHWAAPRTRGGSCRGNRAGPLVSQSAITPRRASRVASVSFDKGAPISDERFAPTLRRRLALGVLEGSRPAKAE